MIKQFKRGICALAAACALTSTMTAAADEPMKVGIQPWLGYGQFYVAKDQNYFAANGLKQVDLVNFDEDKDVNAGLASGNLDAATLATHTAMAMASAGLPVHIVMLLDESISADAIIASPEIKTLADLKGKKIAYEEGATSDILLRNALAKAGIKWSEIQPIPMPASSAGTSLIAGRIPVAVTYEPYLTAAKQQDANVNVLYDGHNQPGIVSDVLVVRDEVLKEKPEQVAALVKSWDDAVKHYRANTKADRAVIAQAVGAPAEDLKTAFDGVKFYSTAENADELTGEFAHKTFDEIMTSASSAGLIPQPVTAAQLIDTRFVVPQK